MVRVVHFFGFVNARKTKCAVTWDIKKGLHRSHVTLHEKQVSVAQKNEKSLPVRFAAMNRSVNWQLMLVIYFMIAEKTRSLRRRDGWW